MDLAALKEIMEMLNTMGESSKEVFLWWLLAKTVPFYLLGLLWTTLFFVVVKSVIHFIKNYTISERIREAAQVYHWWTGRDADIWIQIIKDHANGKYIRKEN